MIPGHGPVTQAVLGTLLTWGLTAAGSALVFVFSSGQVGVGIMSLVPRRQMGSRTGAALCPRVGLDLILTLGGPRAGGGRIQLISLLRVSAEEEEKIKFLAVGCGMCCSRWGRVQAGPRVWNSRFSAHNLVLLPCPRCRIWVRLCSEQATC